MDVRMGLVCTAGGPIATWFERRELCDVLCAISALWPPFQKSLPMGEDSSINAGWPSIHLLVPVAATNWALRSTLVVNVHRLLLYRLLLGNRVNSLGSVSSTVMKD